MPPPFDHSGPHTPPPEERGLEILERIRSAFARKGFEATSMQDIAREAGMSVGNLYRYFPSKTAIVEALIQRDIEGVKREFAQLDGLADPMPALRAGILRRLTEYEGDDCRLSAEISATALRQNEVADRCSEMEAVVCDGFLKVFSRVTGLNDADCRTRYESHARYILLTIRAMAMRSIPVRDPALEALVMRGIDQILAEISACSAR